MWVSSWLRYKSGLCYSDIEWVIAGNSCDPSQCSQVKGAKFKSITATCWYLYCYSIVMFPLLSCSYFFFYILFSFHFLFYWFIFFFLFYWFYFSYLDILELFPVFKVGVTTRWFSNSWFWPLWCYSLFWVWSCCQEINLYFELAIYCSIIMPIDSLVGYTLGILFSWSLILEILARMVSLDQWIWCWNHY